MMEYIFQTMNCEEIRAALRHEIDTMIKRRYGEKPDKKIVKHISKEWDAIEISESVLDVAVLYELTLSLTL